MAKENITKEQLAPKAKEMISAHNLQEIFLCSDEQGFTDKERANDHSRYLSDKTVHHFTSDSVLLFQEGKKESITKVDDTKTDEERQQLVVRYEELFGKKPAHNIGIEKLKVQIQEKEVASKPEETILQTASTPELPLDDKSEESSEEKTEENPAEKKED